MRYAQRWVAFGGRWGGKRVRSSNKTRVGYHWLVMVGIFCLMCGMVCSGPRPAGAAQMPVNSAAARSYIKVTSEDKLQAENAFACPDGQWLAGKLVKCFTDNQIYESQCVVGDGFCGSKTMWDSETHQCLGVCRRRRPSSLDDGGISGLFSSGGPSVRFLTRYDGEVSEPLVGRQGSRVSMRVARGSASLLSSHGRGIWPRDVLKKVS